MSVLPLLMSAYFFYDWKVGYPAKLEQYSEYQKYKKEEKTEEWVKFSASKGWPKEPEEMDQRKIDEQFTWGVGVGILGIYCLVYYLLSYPKKLTCDETSFQAPWSPKIPFTAVEKLDKRPWKHKGLAKVHYKLGNSSKSTSIDDLRFPGADKVLKRLEENFHGEILELEEESPDQPAETSESTPVAPSEKA